MAAKRRIVQKNGTSKSIVQHGIVDCLLTHMHFYLKFVLACGAALKRFEEFQCEDDDVCFYYQTWIPCDGHYRWL
jgi:hypothetical protein